MMISYSQNAEDVRLRCLLGDQACGFYVDIGANDPVQNSVTKHFYDEGWSGINVEPEARCWERLRVSRRRDLNLNLGISDHDGEMILHEAVDRDGWSSFAIQQAENLRDLGYQIAPRRVTVWTLRRLLETHVGTTPIDFLKIDVEYHEAQVIAGGDWQRWRPRIVLVEANEVDCWEPTLTGSGYALGIDDGVNRFYLLQTDSELWARLPQAQSLDGIVHLSFETLCRLGELRSQFPEIDTIGPNALALALRFRRFGARFPRLADLGKRLLARAG